MQAVGPDSFGAVRANLIWLLQKLRSVIYATYEESAHMDERRTFQELYVEAVEDVELAALEREARGDVRALGGDVDRRGEPAQETRGGRPLLHDDLEQREHGAEEDERPMPSARVRQERRGQTHPSSSQSSSYRGFTRRSSQRVL